MSLSFRFLRPKSLLTRTTQRTLLLQTQTHRIYSSSSSFGSQPAPPRLPADQQVEFERLQRQASTQEVPSLDPVVASSAPKTEDNATAATLGETSNLPLRKGAPPEFEGEVNPKTGEVGGPKNEPLRWGSKGDWSFNGRVTDF